ncbi:MerR family transcriptional regulator [Vibrio diazotrophicus]|uniref:MerR family transcriptional regulator n=1 Tax=Vibrio diazotrophicus TaxID=685 RepID=UPI00142DC367|nr:MerR family transcriptional regulator [Vibrio diazotrophicus]NIY94471.1 MerR family transcriptional regulator [Vibrio diazotrophicus]
MAYEQKLYAIREVAELTGVKPVTLRAWQRRYNLVQPQRTEKGHRLFNQENIDSIKEIQGWLAKGVSIGKVSELLKGGVVTDDLQAESRVQLEECEQLLTALSQLNRGKSENIIATVMKEYPLDIVESQFAFPVIDALERVKGPLRSLQKGLFQSLMISKLSSILEAENKAAHKGKCLCVSYDPVGSLLAWFWAVTWSEKGYNVTFLDGVDDVSGLVGSEAVEAYSALALFSHKSLADAQMTAIAKLRKQFNDQCYLSDVLQTLNGLD